MKNYNKNKEPSYFMYLDVNSLYGSTMSQKQPVDGFQWVDTPLIDKKLISS